MLCRHDIPGLHLLWLDRLRAVPREGRALTRTHTHGDPETRRQSDRAWICGHEGVGSSKTVYSSLDWDACYFVEVVGVIDLAFCPWFLKTLSSSTSTIYKSLWDLQYVYMKVDSI